MAAGLGAERPGSARLVTPALPEPLVCRPAEARDEAWITSAWLNSFVWTQDAGPLAADLSLDAYRVTIAKLRARETAQTLVACVAGAEDTLAAFVCGEPGALHYVFVKDRGEPTFRRLGIASALVAAFVQPGERFTFTFRTPTWRAIAEGRGHRGQPVQRSAHWGRGRYDPSGARFEALAKPQKSTARSTP